MAESWRIGQGIDIHRFIEGRPLRLGGVEIPHDKGLEGHSDADALLHAIIDALLGASGRGDIGSFFPDTDPAFKDIDSRELVARVWRDISQEGWKIANIDSTVVVQAPRLAPYIAQIRQSIASLFGITVEQCTVKATTAEKMGSLGRQEGVLAMAVVLLCR